MRPTEVDARHDTVSLMFGFGGNGYGYTACPECQSWLPAGQTCACAGTVPCPADHTLYAVCPLCRGAGRIERAD